MEPVLSGNSTVALKHGPGGQAPFREGLNKGASQALPPSVSPEIRNPGKPENRLFRGSSGRCYSTLMPISFTSRVHLAYSAATCAPHCAADA